MANIIYKTGFIRGLFTLISCTHEISELQIPAEIDGCAVEAIGPDAFLNDKTLTSIIFPDSLQRIDDRAFQGCSSLLSVSLPQNITYLGAFAFADCDSTVSLSIPGSLAVIGYSCFSCCTELREIRLSEGLQVIGNHAFEECRSLTNLKLPQSLTAIGNGAFYNCLRLEFPNLPESLLSVGHSAFFRSGTAAAEFDIVAIPESMQLIGAKAFRCKRLIIKGTPDIDVLYPGIQVIRAPHLMPEFFQDFGVWPAACAGFSEMIAEHCFIQPDISEAYKRSMFEDPQALYSTAVKNPSLLHFLISNSIIPHEDIQLLISACADTPASVAELLQYSSQFAFSTQSFDL